MTSLPIRYASHLSRERSLRKKPTKSDMKQQCAGQKENTPLSWRHILIVPISITISFITRPLWTVPVNSRTFFLSGLAVQRLSDMVCIEHGLSVIEPKPYRERVKRTTFPKKRTKRDELCAAIDQILKKKPKDFSDFVLQLSELGYEFKDGKQPAFRHSGEKRFIRLRSLGEGYSQEDIIAILSGKSVQKASRASKQVHTQREFNLLIDIQAKMAEGKSAGYERWAKKYNRKEAARTVCLLKEKGIGNYEELTALTEQLSQPICGAIRYY